MKLSSKLIILQSWLPLAVSICPITFVAQFEFTCNQTGWVTDPEVLQLTTAGTQKGCASKCLEKGQCKSFSYEYDFWNSDICKCKGSSRCILYSKYFGAMQTEFTNSEDNFLSGRLFERECFSTNCDVIKACKATQDKCELVESDYSYSYESTWSQYACSFGHTAKPYGGEFETTYFNGSLSACEAADKCMYYQTMDGSVDLHYHIPSAQWVCIQFHDQPAFPYRYGEPSSKEQHIVRSRYSVRNESVGAGYGYWLADYYVAI